MRSIFNVGSGSVASSSRLLAELHAVWEGLGDMRRGDIVTLAAEPFIRRISSVIRGDIVTLVASR